MDLTQACQKSPNLVNEILSCIQHPVIIADSDGKIQFANPLVGDMFGYSPYQLEGETLSLFFTPEDLTFMYPNLLDFVKREEDFEGEVMLIRKDKTRFFAYISLRPLSIAKEEKTGVAISIQDIDKFKKLQETFKGDHYLDMVKVADGIAHELRNPLVGIGGFVNRLYESCEAPQDNERYYEFIFENLKKLEGLVEKVEYFAHLPKPSLSQESLKRLIEIALKPYLPQVNKRNIELTVEIDDITLRVDGDLIVRAISILIENALDALSSGGNIALLSKIKDNHCEICVSDTGSGVSADDLPFIFNPFYSTKADGAGIDLAVVKRITESHGGTATVTSQVGKGSTFFLILPLERRRPIRICHLNE